MEEKVERRFIALESKIENLEKRIRELEDITSPQPKPDVLSYLRDKYAKGFCKVIFFNFLIISFSR